MPVWSDFFRLFTYVSEKDPLAQKKDTRNLQGAGIGQPDVYPSLGGGGESGGAGGGQTSMRSTNDMIDTTTLTNRSMRYKEYERLRNVPEIEMTMTVLGDEACVAGDTKVATPFGFQTIESLTTRHKPDERFLVYSWDFDKQDYTLAWAYNPRKVKRATTVRVALDDGNTFTVTGDHRVLKKSGEWVEAGSLEFGDELKPFYRIPASYRHTKNKTKQFPRLYTNTKGWLHERQFVDEWKSGKEDAALGKVNRAIRMIMGGLNVRQIAKLMEYDWQTVENWLQKEGFSNKEIKQLSRKEDHRRVVGVHEGPEMDVYDLSVERHQCFATDSVIMHNCQKDEDGNVFKVMCSNEEAKKEVEFLLRHKQMLNLNRHAWTWFKNLCLMGDWFVEVVVNPDSPKEGIYKTVPLPPESMYRIETTKGKLIEYQQSKEGPDYTAIVKAPAVGQASESELNQSLAIRFAPFQIIHFRIGDDRKTFYPYGQSLVEPARSPAHQLRLMEDAMVVYRLCIRSYDKILVDSCGWKYMKDVRLGDTIYSYNRASDELKKAKVVWHGLVGEKNTYKVKSRHTSVTGTSIHPILVFDNKSGVEEYVRINKIVPGRHYFLRPLKKSFLPQPIHRYYKQQKAVLTEGQKSLFAKTQYASKITLVKECLEESKIETSKKNIQKCWAFLVAADNSSLEYDLGVSLCDRFGLGQPLRKNKGERNPGRIRLPQYVDEEFASLVGFLLGDGCINWNKGSAKLLFAAGEHDALNKKYEQILTKYFGKCKFQQDKRLAKGLGMYCVNSATACEILENLGCGKNSHTKRIPSWVFDERPEIRKAIIRGLADAEGDKRGQAMSPWRTTIRLCNKELVEDIRTIWESLGFHASEVKEIQEPERWIAKTHVAAGVNYEVYLSETPVPFHDEIISVTKMGKEDVYDLTVDYDHEHNFLCNGVPVSNTRAPERRVFYVDVGQLPPFKAEAFIDRLKDQFRKRKTAQGRGAAGANQVEERWQPPAADEDYWLPIRPNSQTRIETLPGAQNLGEIDDAIYFRNKLFTALNFPKNYFANEDVGATRITLSAQDVKFARMVERLQSHFEDGLMEIGERHLQLRGYPEESYQDLKIKMTPPSDWRELSRAEVVNGRYGNASTLKSGQLMADWDIMVRILKYTEDEAEQMLSRLKIQKLEDLKLQVLAQNPVLLGMGIPGQEGQGGQELGSEPGGPSPNPSPDGAPPAGPPPGGDSPPDSAPPGPTPAPSGNTPAEGSPISEPEKGDVKKYDLEIQDYETEQDAEDIDYSVGDR